MRILLLSGAAPISNRVATVTINGLMCQVTYTITAGGTLGGQLQGPVSSHETVTTRSCPENGGDGNGNGNGNDNDKQFCLTTLYGMQLQSYVYIWNGQLM